MLDSLAHSCRHILETHVLYDRVGAGYRGQVRYRCHKVIRTSRWLRERVADAEADARAMLAAKPRARKPATPAVMPSSISLDQAWLLYWRIVCARHGHESRL